MVVYADVCVVNQSTLKLDYYSADERHRLLDAAKDDAEPLQQPESLALLCLGSRAKDEKIRLRVSGVSHTMTRNQQLDSELLSSGGGVMSTGDGRALRLCEPHEKPSTHTSDSNSSSYSAPRLCEPHEKLLLAGFMGTFSSDLSTQSATYYGEVGTRRPQRGRGGVVLRGRVSVTQ